MKIKLNSPQIKFINSDSKTALFTAGRGAGKTFVGCLWILKQMIEYPHCRGLIGANIPKQLNDVVLKQLFSLLRDAGIDYSYGSKPSWIESEDREASYTGILTLQNGASAYCRSMNIAGADNNIRGLEIGWLYIDEVRDLEEEVFSIAIACLRGQPKASYQTRLTTTPAGFNWIYDRFIDENSDSYIKNSKTIKGKTRDNYRHLPENYELDLRSTYSKALARQEIDGEFINLRTGTIFVFDRNKHVSNLDLDPNLPLIFSADQNVQPYCGIVLQIDRKNRSVKVLNEIKIDSSGTTREWAKEAVRLYAGKTNNIEFFCDPSSIKRDTRGGESDFTLMRDELCKTFRNVKDACDRGRRSLEDGINAINSLLDPDLGPPRLIIDKKCKELISDLEKLQYKEGTREIDKSDLKRSHMADALRYPVVQYLPVGDIKISQLNLW
jgi:phage terminase large subunit-like protein